MAWETGYVSVAGLFVTLPNSDITNFTFTDINSYRRASMEGMNIVPPIHDSTMLVDPSQMPMNTPVTWFGFFLNDVNTGTFADKLLVFRPQTYIYDDSAAQDRFVWGIRIVWSIFDAVANTYTDIFYSDTVASSGGAWQQSFPIATAFFSLRTENYQGVDQEIIYGGVQFRSEYSDAVHYIARGMGLPLKTVLEDVYGLTIDPVESKTSPELGPASEPGGGYVPGGGRLPGGRPGKLPTFDNSSDTITPSPLPTLSALSTDLIHAYKVTVQELDDLADALFPNIPIAAADVKEAILGLWDCVFSAKYVDFFLDLLILPINVPAPNLVNMKAGGRFLMPHGQYLETHLVTQQWIEVTCGSLSVDEYWVNFLDFTGTKVKLFLPYVGFVDLQPEYIIGGELTVNYKFNVFDGSFIAQIISTSGYSELDNSLVGQYAGVAAVHVPLQSRDYASKVSGLISAIGTVAAGAASGGVSAAAGIGAMTNLSNTMIQKVGSTHANGYNASSAYLSHRCPYVIIERQWSQFSEKYPDEVGLPANIAWRIGALNGLVTSKNAHLDVIPANKEVKERIGQLLAEGIIVG